MNAQRSNNYFIWIALCTLLALVAIVRVRLLNMPLERDEGEYAYLGRLILEGIPPYKIAYSMNFPGTYFMYAFFMSIFGATPVGIHLGLLTVNLASIFLLFLLGRKFAGNFGAFAAASAYAFLSLSPSVLGFATHATHFIVLPALAGTLLLLKATAKEKTNLYFFAGLLLGCAPIMKQQGLFFPLFGGLFMILNYIFFNRARIKSFSLHLGIFCLGIFIPIAIMFILLNIWGVFGKFWFWTIEYAASYVNEMPLKEAYSIFISGFSIVLEGCYLYWIIAALGIIALFLKRNNQNKAGVLFIVLFFLFSFLSICLGYYFRTHYFITLLPAVALLNGVFIDYVYSSSKQNKKFRSFKYVSYGLFILPLAIGINAQQNELFNFEPDMISKKYFGINPFPESMEIARYINTHSAKEDKIAVLGSEPQILFYADRHSATGYLYTYSLMEKTKHSLDMQKEMTREIENGNPRFIVLVNIPLSWLVRPYSEKYIFDWTRQYITVDKFQLKGFIEVSPTGASYNWDDAALNYQPRSVNIIQIFERK